MASPVADMARECHNMASLVAYMARECHDMARECQPPSVSTTGDTACDSVAPGTWRVQEDTTPGPVVMEGPSQVTGPSPVPVAQVQEPPGLETPLKEEGGSSLPQEDGGFGSASQDQGGETPVGEEEPCKTPDSA